MANSQGREVATPMATRCRVETATTLPDIDESLESNGLTARGAP